MKGFKAFFKPQQPQEGAPERSAPKSSDVGVPDGGASDGGPSPEQPGEPMLPKIPKYEILGELGSGGMGVVYKARHILSGRLEALKVLHVEKAVNSEFRARFLREARILARLDHPAIVKLYDVAESPVLFLAMEFVGGGNLDDWIAGHGRMPWRDAIGMTACLADALQYAYEKERTIHRDVKPQNVLVIAGPGADSKSSETVSGGGDGAGDSGAGDSGAGDSNAGDWFPDVAPAKMAQTATEIAVTPPAEEAAAATPCGFKLADLGLARAESADLQITQPGTVVGSPATMSPEQIEDPDSVDFRTDIYGLGCVLFHALTGRTAFPGKSFAAIVRRKLEVPAPDPAQLVGTLPSAVTALVADMLAPDRAQRPASYAKLIERCHDLVDSGSKSSARPAERSGVLPKGRFVVRQLAVEPPLPKADSEALVRASIEGDSTGLRYEWRFGDVDGGLVPLPATVETDQPEVPIYVPASVRPYRFSVELVARGADATANGALEIPVSLRNGARRRIGLVCLGLLAVGFLGWLVFGNGEDPPGNGGVVERPPVESPLEIGSLQPSPAAPRAGEQVTVRADIERVQGELKLDWEVESVDDGPTPVRVEEKEKRLVLRLPFSTRDYAFRLSLTAADKRGEPISGPPSAIRVLGGDEPWIIRTPEGDVTPGQSVRLEAWPRPSSSAWTWRSEGGPGGGPFPGEAPVKTPFLEFVAPEASAPYTVVFEARLDGAHKKEAVTVVPVQEPEPVALPVPVPVPVPEPVPAPPPATPPEGTLVVDDTVPQGSSLTVVADFNDPDNAPAPLRYRFRVNDKKEAWSDDSTYRVETALAPEDYKIEVGVDVNDQPRGGEDEGFVTQSKTITALKDPRLVWQPEAFFSSGFLVWDASQTEGRLCLKRRVRFFPSRKSDVWSGDVLTWTDGVARAPNVPIVDNSAAMRPIKPPLGVTGRVELLTGTAEVAVRIRNATGLTGLAIGFRVSGSQEATTVSPVRYEVKGTEWELKGVDTLSFRRDRWSGPLRFRLHYAPLSRMVGIVLAAEAETKDGKLPTDSLEIPLELPFQPHPDRAHLMLSVENGACRFTDFRAGPTSR